MEFLALLGGVWASIIFAVFAIAMVVCCTFDRRSVESPKWWLLTVAIVSFVVWTWDGSLTWGDRWNLIAAKVIWAYIGYYLLIGLGYSMLEFMLEVRRSARNWSANFAEFKIAFTSRVESTSAMAQNVKRFTSENNVVDSEIPPSPAMFNQLLVEAFLKKHSFGYNSNSIINIDASADKMGIEPKVNRMALAENIGVWVLFWPFYAISLIIGDLLTEIFRIIADVLASLSGRFVRVAFRNVFKI